MCSPCRKGFQCHIGASDSITASYSQLNTSHAAQHDVHPPFWTAAPYLLRPLATMLLTVLLIAAAALLVLGYAATRGLGHIDELLQVVGPDEAVPPVEQTTPEVLPAR